MSPISLPCRHLRAGLAALFLVPLLVQAASVKVSVSRTQAGARPTDVVEVPWAALIQALPGAQPEKLVVKSAEGKSLVYQFTNFHPDDRRGRYDQVLFPWTFAAGSTSAEFTIETVEAPVVPFPSLVHARVVPERYDDFAWENNRVAHRIYGQGLSSEAAGRSRMISSGVDVWCKKVGYPIVDRWYLRGHDNYHKDNGEGLDFYSVGTGRGAGGTGLWVNGKLFPSRNWAKARVLANGPIRAVFEIDYDEWQAGPSLWVRETRRFTVDVDRNLDRIESTLTITGSDDATAAIGLGKHTTAVGTLSSDLNGAWISLWEKYAKAAEGELATAVILPGAKDAKLAEDELNHLLLVPVKTGRPLVFFAGAGWSHSGLFPNAAAWEEHVKGILGAESDPLKVEVSALR